MHCCLFCHAHMWGGACLHCTLPPEPPRLTGIGRPPERLTTPLFSKPQLPVPPVSTPGILTPHQTMLLAGLGMAGAGRRRPARAARSPPGPPPAGRAPHGLPRAPGLALRLPLPPLPPPQALFLHSRVCAPAQKLCRRQHAPRTARPAPAILGSRRR